MTRPLASVARRGAIAILVVTAICQRADADSASPWHLQASLGYHFSSGEYGEERSTEIGYVPFIASVDHGPWNAELTLPYIRVSGPRGIVGTLGDPASTTTDVRTNSGLGDVQAVFRFTATPKRAWLPTTTAALRIKAPTADEDDGLGTGEWDVTPEIDAAWVVGRFTPFLGLAYEFLGDPGERVEDDGSVTGFELDDAVRGYAGIAAQLWPRWQLGLLVDAGTPTADGAGDRIDIVPFTSVALRDDWLVQVYGTAGLARGSADEGFGIQLTWRGLACGTR